MSWSAKDWCWTAPSECLGLRLLACCPLRLSGGRQRRRLKNIMLYRWSSVTNRVGCKMYQQPVGSTIRKAFSPQLGHLVITVAPSTSPFFGARPENLSLHGRPATGHRQTRFWENAERASDFLLLGPVTNKHMEDWGGGLLRNVSVL